MKTQVTTMGRRGFLVTSVGLVSTLTLPRRCAANDGPSGSIAFVRGDFGHSNKRKIWIVNADATGLRPLTSNMDNPGEDNPTWSPNGKLIAFCALRDGKHHIYFRDLNGRVERCLTKDIAGAEHPAWSPEGGSIAFTVWTEDRKQSHIFVMDADGRDKRQLTHGLGYHDWSPCWTADGAIVFESTRDGNRELYRINTDGNGLARITKHPGTDHAPACSPSGKKVAFMAGREFGNAEICVANLDGSGLVNVSKNPARDSEPTWSPDGNWIAFTRSKGGPAPMDIWIAKADGSGQRNITRSPAGVDNFAPSWGGTT